MGVGYRADILSMMGSNRMWELTAQVSLCFGAYMSCLGRPGAVCPASPPPCPQLPKLLALWLQMHHLHETETSRLNSHSPGGQVFASEITLELNSA